MSYKAFQNKRYYLAFNKFPKSAKSIPNIKAYSNGFRKWKSDDMITYALIVGRFRIMFGVKLKVSACDCKNF